MGKDHAFCLECLARYIDTQVKAQAWPIVCPHENCREVVSSFAVETLLGSEALQWHQLAVEHAIQKKVIFFFLFLLLRKGGRGRREHERERVCLLRRMMGDIFFGHGPSVCVPVSSSFLVLSWFCLFVTNSQRALFTNKTLFMSLLLISGLCTHPFTFFVVVAGGCLVK